MQTFKLAAPTALTYAWYFFGLLVQSLRETSPKTHHTRKMLFTSLFAATLVATGFAQTIPEGYRRVLITSKVDAKFVVVPKSRAANAGLVVYVLSLVEYTKDSWLILF